MSYVEEQRVLSLSTGAADVLTAAAVHSVSVAIMEKCVVRSLYALVSTLVAANTTAPVITYKRRPTYGSATGEVILGSITIPDATAVSKVLYKAIDPVELVPGDQLIFEVTTAATDAGVAAGGAIYGVRISASEEEESNQSNMVASA